MAQDGTVAMDIDELSVAIAHWPVRAWGGAEYLVTKLAEALDSPIHTLGEPAPDDPNPYGDVEFRNLLRGSSIFRRLQGQAGRVFEYALWEDVDWRTHGDPDVLITSGSTTRAVITPDDVLHVNYCHSPPRWFYDLYHDRKTNLQGRLARPLIRHLRTRDTAVDPRVDFYLANSPVIRRRIWKYYKREATVLYPPVDIDSYENTGEDGFYLHLGRLDKEKGVPAIVEAFTDTAHQLVLIGGDGDVSGAVRRQIESADNIEYRGFVDETEKRELLGRCRAVVFNGSNEDFGIVPIEANASGKACLVPDTGFPGLHVEEGINGYHHDGTPDGIRAAIDRVEQDGIEDPAATVTRFSEARFENQLTDFLEAKIESVRLSEERP